LLDAWGWPAMSLRTPRQARHDLRILYAATGSWWPVRNVGDALIDGPGGTIPVRTYRPGLRGDADRPVVVYFHGGGFVVGDLFTAGLDFSLEHTDRDPALAMLLDWGTIEWSATHALPPPLDRADPVISPSRASDLGGLPPAVVITAGVDPFRSDGERYVHALEEAGVAVTWHDFPGQLHGFTDMDLVFPAARDTLQRAAAAVRNA